MATIPCEKCTLTLRNTILNLLTESYALRIVTIEYATIDYKRTLLGISRIDNKHISGINTLRECVRTIINHDITTVEVEECLRNLVATTEVGRITQGKSSSIVNIGNSRVRVNIEQLCIRSVAIRGDISICVITLYIHISIAVDRSFNIEDTLARNLRSITANRDIYRIVYIDVIINIKRPVIVYRVDKSSITAILKDRVQKVAVINLPLCCTLCNNELVLCNIVACILRLKVVASLAIEVVIRRIVALEATTVDNNLRAIAVLVSKDK